MTNIFRHHNQAPEVTDSAIYRDLLNEWADLHNRSTTIRQVKKWGKLEPDLRGYTSPGEIVDAIDAHDRTRANQMLLALVRLFQSGQQVAGRTVLQSLLPQLARNATRASMCTGSEDTWFEDRRAITIAEFWDLMSHYPVEKTTNNVAANLTLNTLHRITRQRDPEVHRTVPVAVVGDTNREAEADRWDAAQERMTSHLNDKERTPTYESHGLTTDADLVQVVAWGIREGVITQRDGQLLLDVYNPIDPTHTNGISATAQQLSETEANVRQRCSRTTRKLAAAVRASLTETEDAPITAAV